jgi:hypothetical protein
MTSTDDTKTTPERTTRSKPSWTRVAKRYGPIVAVVALIAGAVVIFAGGDDDGGDSETGDATQVGSEDELIRSGPMTPEKAELEGVDPTTVDFGPNCDLETGRIMLVTVYAPPCVEQFDGDNGGATSPGVTGDEITIVNYIPDPALDPLTAATIEGAGADVSVETAAETIQGYVDLYSRLFETYGRRVNVETYVGTGAGDDTEAAQADAIAIAEMDPFAVVGGPTQAFTVFGTELASRGIICGPVCALATPEAVAEDYRPYLWSTGPTPDQAAALAAEAIGNLAGPGPAELAGDEALRSQDRVYGLLHYDNPDGDYESSNEAFVEQLADNGIELDTDIEFTLDLARAQENARTVISRLKDAGVTTVLYTGDPLMPASFTKEATAQDYFPEWILGSSVLMDTTLFARQTDQQQWRNGFGIQLTGARGERSTNGAFRIWDWAYGGSPPNNTANVLEPPLRWMFTGIHLAGPELTPETFRDALFRYPVSGGGPTEPQISRGEHGVWPELDWGGVDDVALIWFDPETTGEDEVGNEGTGMYRYANGGERYTFGNLPTSIEEAGLFDVDSSVTVFDRVPPEDEAPDYPPPPT